MLIVRYGVNFRKIVNMDHVGGVKILYKSLVRLFNLYWLFGALLIDWQGCIGWSWKNFNTITAILKWQFRNNIILVGISFFVATLILTQRLHNLSPTIRKASTPTYNEIASQSNAFCTYLPTYLSINVPRFIYHRLQYPTCFSYFDDIMLLSGFYVNHMGYNISQSYNREEQRIGDYYTSRPPSLFVLFNHITLLITLLTTP